MAKGYRGIWVVWSSGRSEPAELRDACTAQVCEALILSMCYFAVTDVSLWVDVRVTASALFLLLKEAIQQVFSPFICTFLRIHTAGGHRSVLRFGTWERRLKLEWACFIWLQMVTSFHVSRPVKHPQQG